MLRHDIRGSAAEREDSQLRTDALFVALRTKTPAQIENYIDTNVTDMASAKQVLKTLAKALVLLARKI